MAASIRFFVAGKPQPRGSKRAFPFKRKDGKLGVAVSDMNPKGKDWMACISLAAQDAMKNRPPIAGPVSLRLEFIMPRPKGHYRKSGELKPTAPHYHTIAPDRGKLARGVEDALSSIIYVDDRQIVGGWTEKHYGDKPGVAIELLEVEPELTPTA